MAGVFLVAWAWREAYLWRLARTPLSGSLTEDARIYWEWSGTLLTHGSFATSAFFLGPLYPYALAGLRALGAGTPTAIPHIQALWGALAIVLLMDAARRLTRPTLALICGGVIALYRMSVFFDGLVLAESLLFIMESTLLWAVAARSGTLRSTRERIVIGVLIGLMAAGRPTSALLLIPAVWTLLPDRSNVGSGARAAAALVLGFALIVVPITVRNRIVSGEWIPITYSFGYNLYVGNNPGATGTYVSVTGTQDIGASNMTASDGAALDGREFLRSQGMDLSPAASSRYWAWKATEYARVHPLRTAQLSILKLMMQWNWREYPQIENADEYERAAGPLGLPLLGSFWFFGVLGITGVLISKRSRPAVRFLAGYVGTLSLAIVPFFVTDRFRYHLVPALVLFSAVALDELLARWKRSQGRERAWLTIAPCLAIALVALPLPHLDRAENEWRTAADLGTRWLDQDRADLAITEFQRAVELERASEHTGMSATAAREHAALYYNYGTALWKLGRREEAVSALEHAAALAPESATIVSALAGVWAASGNAHAADSLYAHLDSLGFGGAMSLVGRGELAAQRGDFDSARRLFRSAVAADPKSRAAWGALIRIDTQTGDLRGARDALVRAKAAGLTDPDVTVYEALLAAASGDTEAARMFLARVPSGAESDPGLAEVLRVTRQIVH